MNKNAISGIQPKTVALLKSKETLHIKEYIIKTWGAEYPNLAENEYFCLKACQKAGIEISNVTLSKNKKFLIVENFIFNGDEILGFEEVLSLMDKNRDFETIGNRMIDSFTVSLQNQTLKELPVELTGTW